MALHLLGSPELTQGGKQFSSFNEDGASDPPSWLQEQRKGTGWVLNTWHTQSPSIPTKVYIPGCTSPSYIWGLACPRSPVGHRMCPAQAWDSKASVSPSHWVAPRQSTPPGDLSCDRICAWAQHSLHKHSGQSAVRINLEITHWDFSDVTGRQFSWVLPTGRKTPAQRNHPESVNYFKN